MELGQVVFSKRGRDRGTAFVVVGLFAESGKQYAWLVDGKRRTADKPKKKKAIHIQETNTVIPNIRPDNVPLDAEIRKALKKYCNSEQSEV